MYLFDACEIKVNHTNLVKLEGFCIDSTEGTCYLVYEYVENGSLSKWLRDRDAARKLNWRARLRIALDLAYGLQYIHEHTWPRVVHKDIKSSNVLLDAKLRAKIANFGLAKTGCNAVTTHIVGTQGYVRIYIPTIYMLYSSAGARVSSKFERFVISDLNF